MRTAGKIRILFAELGELMLQEVGRRSRWQVSSRKLWQASSCKLWQVSSCKLWQVSSCKLWQASSCKLGRQASRQRPWALGLDRVCGVTLTVTLAVMCGAVQPATVRAAEGPRFSREILPILSQHCFACHGPDAAKREADLRLDTEEDAKKLVDGQGVIVAGDPDRSLLMQRITSDDPDLIMPPPESHRALDAAQVETLRQWIAAGAPWGRHWSYEPLEATGAEVSAVDMAGEIDRLVAARLETQGLKLAPRAAPHKLVRRLYLDLIGLPPTPEQGDAFAVEATPEAYQRLVEELLASPQFGEHWGKMWLDLARYADTKGYEKDLGRTVWPYRDWVIDAFNRDLPLDEFTRLQLAGDLSPNATQDELIATAFHRNTMSNDEGGTDDEEFRVAAVKDRVDTTLQVWMGLTMGCAKCHTHKYDPISMQEYYSIYAILNQTEDADRYDDAPLHRWSSDAAQAERARLEQQVQAARARFQELEAEAIADESTSDSASEAQGPLWKFPAVARTAAEGGAELVPQRDASLVAQGPHPDRDVYTLEYPLLPGKYRVLRIEALPEKLEGAGFGVGRSAQDRNFVLSELQVALVAGEAVQALELRNPRSDFAQGGWPVEHAIDGKPETGWAVSPKAGERHGALFEFAEMLELAEPATLRVVLSQQYGSGLTLLRVRCSLSGLDPAGLEPFSESERVAAGRKELAAVEQQLKAFDDAIPAVPILRELPKDRQRVTRIHNRGNFLEPGDEVRPGVLAAFQPLPDGAQPDRLGLARWLTDRNNPLTPRVWANRVWAKLFGTGLVETEEDLGALGSAPTHPELLDYLAVSYRDGGWSLKALLRGIVLSETYQQSAVSSETLRELDPRNTALSRGARYRLAAEVIRDQALAVSGLLSLKQGGPPVMPPQPDGLWRSTYSGLKWVNAENEDRWRRSLYTYWKRTTPYPTLTTFDAGSREVCQVRRISTNTPLQALVTLNDPVFLEAAGALAVSMEGEPAELAEQLRRGMRQAVIRPVELSEVEPLVRLWQAAHAAYSQDAAAADSLLATGRCGVPADAAERPALAARRAAFMTVANAILNLDELLTRN
jgi:mono/diheme cytochrome c family protein